MIPEIKASVSDKDSMDISFFRGINYQNIREELDNENGDFNKLVHSMEDYTWNT